ncbi:Glucose/arabinose dehydrogenase, beta-propeller fold [Micromonospora pattaloongensis]|uniref:Glucose/arabinose dehydrogenase, beta-propeller fold n=1 Tax=Micromonospora pattaloongensis TaxID=405436 RepID=A0A1H3KZ37_9ACTN|nr:PQQ-dependent sugar dehydrogenase [Micromonospora pattaloongensis]SDY56915.1 Glucose/arabinose dehydrogenase, beta-propeller fold [Micromonospora pattaloongensis]
MSARPPYPRRSRTRACAAAGAALALAVGGCAFGEPTPDVAGKPPSFPTPSVSATGGGTDQQVAATVLATGLRVPWGVAFLPDGGALVTERDTAKILKVGPESDTDGLKVTVVQTLDEVDAAGEGGLMGIAVSPRYADDRTVFVYYSTSRDNRVAKLTLGGEPTPIVTGIPLSGIHNGGRLAFGPDGFLYATTGDASHRGLSQDRASLGGKILRMTTDGKPAPGNPFGNSLVWSLGHRNVQGIAWDAGKRLYATEFGQSTWDEINRIEPGKNYGWPDVEGHGTDSRFVNPLVVWRTGEASCSGAAIVGPLLVAACLRGQRLWLTELTANGGVLGQPRALLTNEYGRLRTAVAAPDGSLWITTSNHDARGRPTATDDRIIRLVFAGAAAGKS